MLGSFSPKGFRKYVNAAKRVLESNWTGSYTKPSSSLYPHQWNWDSGFIAIGYAHYHQPRAQQEILSLFSAQWPNGMVPQIVFNHSVLGHYFPEPDFWRVPGGAMTSGITMPPLHATACLRICRQAKDGDSARAFLKEMYAKLVSAHRYFYDHRDPRNEGLVYIRHPWESGLDNSPTWDVPLNSIEIDKNTLPAYNRKDLETGVPADQRPSDRDYDRYVHLVDLFRRHGYDEQRIFQDCPFLIQDVLFNSILCRANKDLVEIGRTLREDVAEVEAWSEQTTRALSERLWCQECRRFEAFDLRRNTTLHVATAASFMPLFAGAASRQQAELIYDYMDSVSFCALKQGSCFTIPNYDMTREDFDPKNYWRGPVWININWMLAAGLKRYKYNEKADAMKKDIIQLPLRFGFHEYFDSRTGQGYGSPSFSWTAALFLDLIHEYYDEDQKTFMWLGPMADRKLNEKRVLNEWEGHGKTSGADVAPKLMQLIGDLKRNFYDPDRGRVDYGAVKDSHEYHSYLEVAAQLRAFDLASIVSREEKLAFWINLYNVMVIHGIIVLDVTSSVREVPNFFENISYRIGESIFSLDDIEHGVLRANSRPPYHIFPPFAPWDGRRRFIQPNLDPRIHFALVCGSRSCAPILFYEPDLIDEQLDEAAENFVNSSEVIILPEKMLIYLSQIFLWYGRDFGGKKKVFEFLIHFLRDKDQRVFLQENSDRIEVEYLFYDWNLNH